MDAATTAIFFTAAISHEDGVIGPRQKQAER
jgi:hypothetical protein